MKKKKTIFTVYTLMNGKLAQKSIDANLVLPNLGERKKKNRRKIRYRKRNNI